MKRRVLITGGSGFLGGYLVQLATKDFEVYATYHKNPVGFEEVQWRQLDLRNALEVKNLLGEIRPEAIIHNAAAADIDFCEREKSLAKAINYYGTIALAEEGQQLGSKLIFVSTDNVFKGDQSFYREDARPEPINYYGETKLLAEETISKTCEDFIIARAALIYGKPVANGNSFSEWIFNNLKAGKYVPVYVDQFRTPVHVVNLAEALLELAVMDWRGIIHLAGPQRMSRYEFANIFCEIFGFSKKYLEMTYMKDAVSAAKRPVDLSLDITRAKKMLKSQLLNCVEGLRQMKLSYY